MPEGGIIDFVKFLNEGKDVPEAFKEPIYIEANRTRTHLWPRWARLRFSLQWNSGYGENVMSFANDIYTPEGGMHLEGLPHRAHPRDQRLCAQAEPAQGKKTPI